MGLHKCDKCDKTVYANLYDSSSSQSLMSLNWVRVLLHHSHPKIKTEFTRCPKCVDGLSKSISLNLKRIEQFNEDVANGIKRCDECLTELDTSKIEEYEWFGHKRICYYCPKCDNYQRVAGDC